MTKIIKCGKLSVKICEYNRRKNVELAKVIGDGSIEERAKLAEFLALKVNKEWVWDNDQRAAFPYNNTDIYLIRNTVINKSDFMYAINDLENAIDLWEIGKRLVPLEEFILEQISSIIKYKRPDQRSKHIMQMVKIATLKRGGSMSDALKNASNALSLLAHVLFREHTEDSLIKVARNLRAAEQI
jgi:hypothetical protein